MADGLDGGLRQAIGWGAMADDGEPAADIEAGEAVCVCVAEPEDVVGDGREVADVLAE